MRAAFLILVMCVLCGCSGNFIRLEGRSDYDAVTLRTNDPSFGKFYFGTWTGPKPQLGMLSFQFEQAFPFGNLISSGRFVGACAAQMTEYFDILDSFGLFHRYCDKGRADIDERQKQLGPFRSRVSVVAGYRNGIPVRDLTSPVDTMVQHVLVTLDDVRDPNVRARLMREARSLFGALRVPPPKPVSRW